ncbi:hypothetical protein [Natrarchaeobius halalkaliphilus]
MVATMFLFAVPYATELNPITNLFFGSFGFLGVILAALCYAAIIVLMGGYLPDPIDIRFVAALAVIYGVFVINNVLLLVSGTSLISIVAA